MNCLLYHADEGRVSFLTVLDLSAVSNMLDHSILLAHLCDMLGISGKAFESFHCICLIDPVCQHQQLGLFTKEASLPGSSELS